MKNVNTPLFAKLLTGVALTLLIGLTEAVTAQELLTLEEAVNVTLANNPDVQVERYDAEMATNNVFRGNSGQLPTVEIRGSYDYTHQLEQNIDLGELADILAPDPGGGPGGTPTDVPLGGENLTSQAAGASLTVNYVLFNGFQGRYRYRQLQTQDSLTQTQLTATLENTFVQTLTAYLNAAQYQAQLNVQREAIAISSERLRRAQLANEYGGANKLEMLRSEVDLSNDSINFKNTQLAYHQAKQQLAQLLAQPLDNAFIVEEDIALLSDKLTYQELNRQMLDENHRLRAARYSIRTSEYNQQLQDARRYPSLSAVAGFNYNYQQNENAFPEQQEAYGPTVGLRLNYALFDGGQRKVARQNAQLSVQQQQARVQSTQLQLETELLNTYQRYENYLSQWEMVRENLQVSELTFQQAQEAYELGSITGTDLRNAQLNLTNARNRLVTLTYEVKKAETQLLQLSGDLTVAP